MLTDRSSLHQVSWPLPDPSSPGQQHMQQHGHQGWRQLRSYTYHQHHNMGIRVGDSSVHIPITNITTWASGLETALFIYLSPTSQHGHQGWRQLCSYTYHQHHNMGIRVGDSSVHIPITNITTLASGLETAPFIYLSSTSQHGHQGWRQLRSYTYHQHHNMGIRVGDSSVHIPITNITTWASGLETALFIYLSPTSQHWHQGWRQLRSYTYHQHHNMGIRVGDSSVHIPIINITTWASGLEAAPFIYLSSTSQHGHQGWRQLCSYTYHQHHNMGIRVGDSSVHIPIMNITTLASGLGDSSVHIPIINITTWASGLETAPFIYLSSTSQHGHQGWRQLRSYTYHQHHNMGIRVGDSSVHIPIINITTWASGLETAPFIYLSSTSQHGHHGWRQLCSYTYHEHHNIGIRQLCSYTYHQHHNMGIRVGDSSVHIPIINITTWASGLETAPFIYLSSTSQHGHQGWRQLRSYTYHQHHNMGIRVGDSSVHIPIINITTWASGLETAPFIYLSSTSQHGHQGWRQLRSYTYHQHHMGIRLGDSSVHIPIINITTWASGLETALFIYLSSTSQHVYGANQIYPKHCNIFFLQLFPGRNSN